MDFDFEARTIIEALRSGIPSRAVGKYFAQARPRVLADIEHDITMVGKTGQSSGKIISGKYGEGKTHLLNTIFNYAHDNNMVVSMISLSKETPFNKLYDIYRKLMANTYLPGKKQPGFIHVFQEKLTLNSNISSNMLLYCLERLDTDRLFFLLKDYIHTNDMDEKALLQSDLEGDFIPNTMVKSIYFRVFNQRAKFKVNFVKSRHYQDYYYLMSNLFKNLGYDGWVILFDETELLGRLGNKTRMDAYRNMGRFLFPADSLESVYTLFAISSSYVEDVIEGKKDNAVIDKYFSETPEVYLKVIEKIKEADQLSPLTEDEMRSILSKIVLFHFKSYDWHTEVDMNDFYDKVSAGGYLLRSKIRAAIEYLDILYQYRMKSHITINKIDSTIFEKEFSDE
ncbi:MAG: ATP-binding protein [Spirochaetia bacterium]|jgi:hypothetical protein|nr:ATP-binding protein [Spirochaetia bacterium]